MLPKHKKLSVLDLGVFISVTEPHLAASPDALVTCECCGKGCLEIKCPYCIKDTHIFEEMERKNFCLEFEDDKISINKSHPYYYQVQHNYIAVRENTVISLCGPRKTFTVRGSY